MSDYEDGLYGISPKPPADNAQPHGYKDPIRVANYQAGRQRRQDEENRRWLEAHAPWNTVSAEAPSLAPFGTILGIGVLCGGVYFALMSILRPMLRIAKDGFPDLVGLSSTWLAKIYGWLFRTPIRGGRYVFQYVAAILHARFPNYGDIFALAAVCCCVIFLIWGMGKVCKVRAATVLSVVGVIYIAPALLYGVWILLLDLAMFGQHIIPWLRSLSTVG